MDPLSAFGLACNVITVIGCGSKLLTKTWHIYRSTTGQTEEDAQTEYLSQQLQASNEQLRSALGDQAAQRTASSSTSSTDQALLEISRKCNETARKLLDRLDAMKLPRTAKKRDKIKASLRLFKDSLSSSNEILRTQLDNYRRQMTLDILISLRDKLGKDRLLHIGTDEEHRERFGEQGQDVARMIQVGRFEECFSIVTDRLDALENNLSVEIANDGNATRRDIREEGLLTRKAIGDLARTTPSCQENERLEEALQSLTFKEILDERDDLTPAQEETFAFVFKPPQAKNWSDFGKWLASQDSSKVYWISGKAGSGKSTLMKFVLDRVKSESYVSPWAKRREFHVASHFFWYRGTELQKTAVGMLRSLLFKLLRSCPKLRPVVFDSHERKIESSSWTLPTVKKKWLMLQRRTPVNLKLLLIIDGLDELEGDKDELIELVMFLNDMPWIKVCVASRPWPIFEDSFGRLPKLRLHELTYDSIYSFVLNTLGKSRKCKHEAKRKDVRLKDISEEIAKEAHGIFVWAALVVKRFKMSLIDGTSLQEARNEIQTYPHELDELYHDMLNRIKPAYRSQAAFLFLGLDSIMRRSDFDYSVSIELLVCFSAKLGDSIFQIASREQLTEDCRVLSNGLPGRFMGLFTHDGFHSDDDFDDDAEQSGGLCESDRKRKGGRDNDDAASIRSERSQLLDFVVSEMPHSSLVVEKKKEEDDCQKVVRPMHKSVLDFLDQVSVRDKLAAWLDKLDLKVNFSKSDIHDSILDAAFRQLRHASIHWVRTVFDQLEVCFAKLEGTFRPELFQDLSHALARRYSELVPGADLDLKTWLMDLLLSPIYRWVTSEVRETMLSFLRSSESCSCGQDTYIKAVWQLQLCAEICQDRRDPPTMILHYYAESAEPFLLYVMQQTFYPMIMEKDPSPVSYDYIECKLRSENGFHPDTLSQMLSILVMSIDGPVYRSIILPATQLLLVRNQIHPDHCYKQISAWQLLLKDLDIVYVDKIRSPHCIIPMCFIFQCFGAPKVKATLMYCSESKTLLPSERVLDPRTVQVLEKHKFFDDFFTLDCQQPSLELGKRLLEECLEADMPKMELSRRFMGINEQLVRDVWGMLRGPARQTT